MKNVNTVNRIKTTILLKALYDTKYLFILKVVMCIYGQKDNWLVKIIFIPVNKKVFITVTSPYRTPGLQFWVWLKTDLNYPIKFHFYIILNIKDFFFIFLNIKDNNDML